MRTLLLLFFLETSFYSHCQLYNLIYMDNVDGSTNFDYNSNAYAGQFTNAFTSKDYKLAVLFLDSLTFIGRWDHKIAFNKAICFKLMNQKDSCSFYTSQYLKFSTKKIKPGMVKKSILHEWVLSDKTLCKSLSKHIRKKYKKLSDSNFAMDLEVTNAFEQEILMDSNYMNNRKRPERFERLAANFEPVKEMIQKNGLPNQKQIGESLGMFTAMILHMDYDPESQLRIAREMLILADKNKYHISTVLYTIDRALRNLNKEQEYGSLIKNRGTEKSEIYKYVGTIEELNARRAKYGLVPMHIEVKGYEINQMAK